MTLSRLIARPLLASGFVLGAVSALRHSQELAPKAASVADKIAPTAHKAGVPLPQDAQTLVKINAAAQIVGGLALATGRAPRLGALVLAVTTIPATVVEHPFWSATSPDDQTSQRLHFVKNLSMIGGALIAAGDLEGKPGVAYRASHATKAARREAKHLAVASKREARIAKATLS